VGRGVGVVFDEQLADAALVAEELRCSPIDVDVVTDGQTNEGARST